MTYHYGEPSPFPPSFEGNPWAYGFGLFGDVVASALALTLLLTYVFEARRFREVSRAIGNAAPNAPHAAWSPLFLYRTTISSLLTFVVLRALPDALWMLAWGEVTEPTIRLLLATDMIADGVALGPFFLAIMCWCWGRQVIPQMLVEEIKVGVSGGPPWDVIWKNGRIVFCVMLIAIGVTIGKAAA